MSDRIDLFALFQSLKIPRMIQRVLGTAVVHHAAATRLLMMTVSIPRIAVALHALVARTRELVILIQHQRQHRQHHHQDHHRLILIEN